MHFCGDEAIILAKALELIAYGVDVIRKFL